MEAISASDRRALIERLERLERQNRRLGRSYRMMKFITLGAIMLCASLASIPTARSGKIRTLIEARSFDLVDSSGKVLASWGPTSDGVVLTFFDSAGKKTLTLGNDANESLTGLLTWDNNNVVGGNGVVRTFFGESNPNNAGGGGFGAAVFDGNETPRAEFGQNFDLTSQAVVFNDQTGRSSGVGIFPSSLAGYFANDSNGVTRQFGGLIFDSDLNEYLNEIGLTDPNNVLRVSAAQLPADFSQHGRSGNGFAIWDPSGLQQASMSAYTDGSLAGFNVVDENNIDRMSAYLTGTGMQIITRDSNGTVTGSLP